MGILRYRVGRQDPLETFCGCIGSPAEPCGWAPSTVSVQTRVGLTQVAIPTLEGALQRRTTHHISSVAYTPFGGSLLLVTRKLSVSHLMAAQSAKLGQRPVQVTVWGASGFTGRLVCEHLVQNYQASCCCCFLWWL